MGKFLGRNKITQYHFTLPFVGHKIEKECFNEETLNVPRINCLQKRLISTEQVLQHTGYWKVIYNKGKT